MDIRTLSSSGKELPFFPMPDESSSAIRDALGRRFISELIQENHVFTANNQRGRIRVNYATFTNKNHYDLDTSAVTVYYEPSHNYSDNEIINQVALSGSPFVFIAREQRVFPYGVNVNGKVQPILLADALPYSEVGNFFDIHKKDIDPFKIQAVKNGSSQFEAFSNLQSLQLRLFALDVTKDLLAEIFSNAVQILRAGIIEIEPNVREKQVVEIAVRILGAIILAHKGRLGSKYQKENVPFFDLFQGAVDVFPAYFEWESIKNYHTIIEDTYRSLQKATYSSFTPDMLSELYIRAYPNKTQRKLEGRFDTPLYLTRHILNNIPIETIKPEKRKIADITCGWGSFLIAGFERLSGMVEMKQFPLRDHIFGNDKDHFTAELARVALLTTSLQDNWNVDDQDALEIDMDNFKPTVIVGNPKFSGDRKRGEKTTEVSISTGLPSRLQEADKFLLKAIELLEPGGYLGMLMPQSFTISESSTEARKALLENCDVLELWDLPLDIFGNQARVSPMVIFAKKRFDTGTLMSYPVRIRNVQGRSLERTGKFHASNISPSQSSWGINSVKARKSKGKVSHLMTHTVILSESRWIEISKKCLKFADISEILLGAIVGSKRRWKDYPQPKLVPWLSGAKKTIPRSFYINYGSKTILYPNDLEEPRKNKRSPERDKEKLLSAKKVLLVADPNPSWGQRTKVAIDREGYYVSDSFWVFVPKHDFSLEVIAAILSWDICNAWIVEHLRYPKIPRWVLEDIPFPPLSTSEVVGLTDAIRSIEASAQLNQENLMAQQQIDNILIRAYGLDDHTFKILRKIKEWDPNTNEVMRTIPPSTKSLIRLRGQVEAVNSLDQSITFWFDGIDGVHTTPIVDGMPGWMLRPGASFVAEFPYDVVQKNQWQKLEWWNIYPKEFTYLTEDELLDRIGIELKTD